MTSTIKVNNIQNQCGANIINESANTITIGASGDTINLASGASQTGFGRTGTVDWQTGDIKTATFTAANGEGYFCNTAGGTFEVDLPAGSAGAIVSVQDYNNTFDSNSLTIDPNGSEKINGGVAGGSLTLTTKGQGVTFVYIDATVGWRTVAGSDDPFADAASNFIVATVSGSGNTLVTAPCCANTKIATFTGPGSLCVSNISPTPANNEVSYMVVAGGGAGASTSNSPGSYGSGGGGAGGYREVKSPAATGYTASPLDGYSTPGNRVSLTVGSIPITVGAGGTTQAYNACGAVTTGPAQSGSNSVFSTITSAGGGGGGPGCNAHANSPPASNMSGRSGGSGGGSGARTTPTGGGPGAGNTPPVTPPQGNNGGEGTCSAQTGAGGGGGAGAVGTSGTASVGQPGGAGVASSISSASVTRAGGGGGGAGYPGGAGTPGSGGTGGGGAGNGNSPTVGGVAGTANTGGGGGGSGSQYDNAVAKSGGNGGSGIVIIRYKFQ
jgi:hypothetical protein